MPTNTFANILSQAMRRNNFSVMAKKVVKRLVDGQGRHSQAENLAWLKQHCCSFEELAADLDADLWRDAQKTSRRLEEHANQVLNHIEYDLGGGGAYPFLYYVTRYLKPSVILETGVAAGFSSYAFLAALQQNHHGKLYSSDFPYFRLPNPEKYVGVVVEEALKENWSLYLDGDEANLPQILAVVNTVDIFHYDSDKSYSGRDFALSLVSPYLSPKALIIMDDIQDNSYFYDYIERTNPAEWYVFDFKGKYVGVIGRLKNTES